VAILERYPDGIAKKHEKRLRAEAERCYLKADGPPKDFHDPQPKRVESPSIAPEMPGDGPERKIKATPFVCRDPRKIPPREWLYGRHMVRKFVSLTVAPSGVGESSKLSVESAAMVTNRDLLDTGSMPNRSLRVWY
jgi:hypothetical protein